MEKNSKKALIIFGSARSDGKTRLLADEFMRRSGADFVDLNTLQISYYDYEHQNEGDDFLPLITKALEYECLIFISPVYWYSMSAVMKNFFDRISDLLTIRKDLGRRLRGKSMMAICCSSDDERYPVFFQPFVLSANYLGINYLGDVHGWVGKEGVPAQVLADMERLLERLAVSDRK